MLREMIPAGRPASSTAPPESPIAVERSVVTMHGKIVSVGCS